MKILLAFLAFILAANAANPVVRPAPDIRFAGSGKKSSLRSLRGQPVVLLIAKNSKSRAFRKQVGRIESIYPEFASRGTVFICAFAEDSGPPQSDIPFVIASNGPGVVTAYQTTDGFGIAVIGKDGNMDFLSDQITPAFRIREIIQNNYQVQNDVRKQQPKGPPE